MQSRTFVVTLLAPIGKICPQIKFVAPASKIEDRQISRTTYFFDAFFSEGEHIFTRSSRYWEIVKTNPASIPADVVTSHLPTASTRTALKGENKRFMIKIPYHLEKRDGDSWRSLENVRSLTAV